MAAGLSLTLASTLRGAEQKGKRRARLVLEFLTSDVADLVKGKVFLQLHIGREALSFEH